MIADMWLGDVWGWIGAAITLAFLALIALGIVALLRAGVRVDAGDRGHPAALSLLEERYARGEISRDEFVERRDVLTRPPAGGR